jgi:glutamate/tyrosine decarboxylase-like PLP-dependent enzyme
MSSDIPTQFRQEMEPLVRRLQEVLPRILLTTDERRSLQPDAEAALAQFTEPLPDEGCGAARAIDELLRWNEIAGANTAGPKCYHFVIGGNTPAAHAADLLASALDTITYTWVLSPCGVEMERQALDWLKELLELPAAWPGIMVTGASMANFVCLAAARQWWGHTLGVDVSDTGMQQLPPLPVLTSGFVHASTLKVLALLGIGRRSVERFQRDEFGRMDLEGFRARLEALDGQPAIVVLNAGEVNAGEFDPIADAVAIARRHNCWVHVDGAFGLFARTSPRTADLVAGVEHADSVTVDGHKWLNVPYDSGYAFVRSHDLLAEAFRYTADYLPAGDDARPTLGAIGPESSRRARSFAVWATLKAYGRNGHRRVIEHCLDIARHFAEVVDSAEDLELMNEPRLSIVAFRYNPGGMTDEALDELNERLGQAVVDDGRFLVGTSRWGRRTVFRPAFTNWRTRREDVEALVRTVSELARTLR